MTLDLMPSATRNFGLALRQSTRPEVFGELNPTSGDGGKAKRYALSIRPGFRVAVTTTFH